MSGNQALSCDYSIQSKIVNPRTRPAPTLAYDALSCDMSSSVITYLYPGRREYLACDPQLDCSELKISDPPVRSQTALSIRTYIVYTVYSLYSRNTIVLQK